MTIETFICAGNVYTYDNPNGPNTIAVIDRHDPDWICVALNYRQREDEKDRVWWNDSLYGDLEQQPSRPATHDEILELVRAVLKSSDVTKPTIDFHKQYVFLEQEYSVDDRPLTF